MRMDGELQVASQRRHLDREYAFGDQFPCAGPGYADTQDLLGFRINDELGDTVTAVERGGTSAGGPREARNLDGTLLCFRLGFRQAAPGNFRIGEDDRGNGARLKHNIAAGD